MSHNAVPRPTFRRCSTLALAVLVALAGCAPTEAAPEAVAQRESAIVGGVASAQGAYPAVGSLVINFFGMYQSFCTGTLISKRFLLTAGHCVKNPQIQGQPFGVYFGNSVAQASSQNVIPVESTHPHPQFVLTAQAPNDLADWYDIALIKLSADAPVEPMKMLRPDQAAQTYRYGAEARVAGFGLTDKSNMFSSGTKYEAAMQMADVASSEVMLGGSGHGIPCEGDSGGPTFMNAATDGGEDWRLVGVTSRGDENCSLLSIQTRLDPYLDFIHGLATDVICDSGKNGESCTITPPPSSTKKAFGAFCTAPTECVGGLCAEVGAANHCTQACKLDAPDCPSGAQCVAVNETTAVCVGEGWDRGGMGASCAQPSDCASSMCAVLADRAFCTVTCEPETGCGDESISCEPAGDVHVCVPPKESGGGCQVGDAGGAAVALLLSALLLALAGRRRRARCR